MGLRYPLQDEVDFYVVDAQGQVRQHHATGDRRPFATRPVAAAHFYVNVPLRTGEAGTVYVRLRSMGSLQVPLVVTTPTARLDLSRIEFGWMGLYGGALLAMAQSKDAEVQELYREVARWVATRQKLTDAGRRAAR